MRMNGWLTTVSCNRLEPEMDHPLAVVLIPGPGLASKTLTSLADELAGSVPLISFGLDESTDLGGVTVANSADEVLGTAATLAFVRVGDRLHEGALAARLTPFAARSEAVLSVAGYRLVDGDGNEIRISPPPLPPFAAHSLLLRPAVEASAVLVRSEALDQIGLDLIVRPHGDAVVWGRLGARFGLVPSSEIAADVRLDPARHGHAPAIRLAALLELARSGELATPAPDALTLRRELLRRMYIEPVPADSPRLDLSLVFSDGGAPIVADLQWALERQRDALSAERVTWPQGIVAPEDETPGPTDLDLLDARMLSDELHHHIMVRDTELLRLNALLEQRESLIARLQASRSGGA
jgi:hypothetical protein